ncbi:MAG TPA: HlyD family efflux transporter periplasmic adaptor subunit, partial [Tepidisphaeraceae bacterium]
GQIVAVSAVITRCHDLEKARQRLISMQLVAGYFELYSLRRGADQARMIAEGHQSVLQLATSVATAEGFESAAMNLCNELALRTGAVRVSLGWMKGNNIRVKALSNTEKFDKKQELIVQLEKVMEECWDQDEIVQFDPDGNSSQNVTRSAAELSRAQGGNVVLSLPLRRQSEIEGVVTLEFAAKQVVSPQTANALAIAVDLLAPQLYDRFQNDRWLIVKTGQSIKHGAEATIGPKHMLAKVLIALAIGVGVFVSVFRWNYHVSAPFQFVPVEKYSICAPFEGYIRNVLVKPGDHVAANDVLVELDTKDLELKREEFQSRADALENEIAKDAADPTKRADEKIATDNRKEALAQVAYYDRQVEKGKIRAPHDGEIVRGDLTDKLGAPVKQGDVMMEIADRNDLRAEIAVNERDIQDLNVFADGKPLPGSHGFLATTSLPNERFPFKIDRIVPLGDAKEGSNVFTVYGTLEKKSELWRPGMIGEARIEVGHRRLVWVWTHRLIDFLRMKLWM